VAVVEVVVAGRDDCRGEDMVVVAVEDAVVYADAVTDTVVVRE
jgi:hypothetical protein